MQLQDILAQVPEDGLFKEKSWRFSPKPLPLSKKQRRRIESLGHIFAQFQRACEEMYNQSVDGFLPAWIHQLLDAGKPDWLIEQNHHPLLRGQIAKVIRPDLLVTEQGFSLTELDSVPGGIGLTAWLTQVYEQNGESELLGSSRAMLDQFRALLPDGGDLWVSDECGDYLPEMQWLTKQLNATSGEASWDILHADSASFDGRDLYRFFELFDWQNIQAIPELAEYNKNEGLRAISPPLRSIHEEKLWLALFWSPSLQSAWKKLLRGTHHERLKQLIPYSWVLDQTPLPPNAAIPKLNVHDWRELKEWGRSQRELVLKISGFNESAWGGRSVFVGHDLSTEEWGARLQTALDQQQTSPWLLQEFHPAAQLTHPYFDHETGVEIEMTGRTRLCPYYFIDAQGQTKLAGCLATIVPADKKKIHGMSEAILTVCAS